MEYEEEREREREQRLVVVPERSTGGKAREERGRQKRGGSRSLEVRRQTWRNKTRNKQRETGRAKSLNNIIDKDNCHFAWNKVKQKQK